MNVFAGVLMGTGVASHMGIETNVGGDEQVDEITRSDQDVDTGSPTGETLFGMYNVLTDQVGGIFDVIYPGIQMMENAGMPTYITEDILEPVASVMITIGIISFLRGWDL